MGVVLILAFRREFDLGFYLGIALQFPEPLE
jgi:hypothetical protein